MNKTVKKFLLSGLLIFGISRTTFTYFNVGSECLRVLTGSPLVNVFTNKSFFLEKKIIFDYGNRKIDIPTKYIINAPGSNIYSGKIKYNSIFMTNVLSTELVEATGKILFCDRKALLNFDKEYPRPNSVVIQYLDPQKTVVKNVIFSCN